MEIYKKVYNVEKCDKRFLNLLSCIALSFSNLGVNDKAIEYHELCVKIYEEEKIEVIDMINFNRSVNMGNLGKLYL